MTRSLLLFAVIATPVSLAQDIAPKDSERDPVVSALTEGLGEGPIESGIPDTPTPPLMTGEDGAPVLVTGTPPEGAEIEEPEPVSTTSTADALLAGPRGRRMLLDYVMDAEEIRRPEPHDDSFRSTIFLASYHLDPERDSRVTYSSVAYEPGAQEPPEEPLRAVVTADDVADRLSQVVLPEDRTSVV